MGRIFSRFESNWEFMVHTKGRDTLNADYYQKTTYFSSYWSLVPFRQIKAIIQNTSSWWAMTRRQRQLYKLVLIAQTSRQAGWVDDSLAIWSGDFRKWTLLPPPADMCGVDTSYTLNPQRTCMELRLHTHQDHQRTRVQLEWSWPLFEVNRIERKTSGVIWDRVVGSSISD